ncbi:MAG: M23 family metallopeptidase [Actinobacteria bacterium]|nr:M23 family metallopeptidase [Actinomycetota bacterium]
MEIRGGRTYLKRFTFLLNLIFVFSLTFSAYAGVYLEKGNRVEVEAKKPEASAPSAPATQKKRVLKRRTRRVARAPKASVSREAAPQDNGFRTEGFVFPVAGPHQFSNDWGSPRGRGRRHKGNDIFAEMNTPVVAVVNGTVSREQRGGTGGIMLWLNGDDGNVYFYAHLSGYAVSTGTRVTAGQTIAFVGNTGNARGGSPHLHFEIHLGGGRAVNPFETLDTSD